jgi:hypothetical protein
MIRRELTWLHDLVSLELVADPFSETAEFFSDALEDEEDITRSCLLAEKVTALLEAVGKKGPEQEETRHAA